VAVREPRVTDKLSLIRDLLEIRKVDLRFDTKPLAELLERCANQRDQLAHGTWTREPKTNVLFLRLTKGSWQPVKGQKGKTKQLIKPEGIQYSADDCRALREEIRLATKMVLSLGRAIRDAYQASPQTRPPQPQGANPP